MKNYVEIWVIAAFDEPVIWGGGVDFLHSPSPSLQ